MISHRVFLQTRILTLALATQFSGMLIAQNSGSIQNSKSTRPQLITIKAVQEDLGMSMDQIREASVVALEFQAVVRKRMLENGFDPKSLTGLSPEQRLDRMRQMAQAGTKAALETERLMQTKLDLVLEPEQNKRLREIQIQLLGLSALKMDDIASRLGLSVEQKAEMARLEDESRQLIQKSIEKSAITETDADFARSIRLQRQAIDFKIIGLLDTRQKSLFEQMKGPAFDISKIRPMTVSPSSGGNP